MCFYFGYSVNKTRSYTYTNASQFKYILNNNLDKNRLDF